MIADVICRRVLKSASVSNPSRASASVNLLFNEIRARPHRRLARSYSSTADHPLHIPVHLLIRHTRTYGKLKTAHANVRASSMNGRLTIEESSVSILYVSEHFIFCSDLGPKRKRQIFTRYSVIPSHVTILLAHTSYSRSAETGRASEWQHEHKNSVQLRRVF
ncbi:hypothetical protein Q7C36_021161 [Tachysurus vachellii]|uniref:Uncharacterized protein n=1 Tax=Tachysurus vachellii TaxID=175792 RepID=A0AA88LQJ3_TACVA|nr:hypothetical protein Q7C36_021161 [Tachysurus vachellii]